MNINYDNAIAVKFIVFGTYQHGKRVSQTNRKSIATVTIYGEDGTNGVDVNGQAIIVPAFVNAIRRLKEMCGKNVVYALAG